MLCLANAEACFLFHDMTRVKV